MKGFVFTTLFMMFVIVALGSMSVTHGMPLSSQLSTFAFMTMQTLQEMMRPVTDFIRSLTY